MNVRRCDAKRRKVPPCALLAAIICLFVRQPADSPVHAAAPKPSRLVVVLYPQANGHPGNGQDDHGIRTKIEGSEFWSQHKWQLLALVGICAVQALLIAGMIVQRRRRTRTEHRIRQELQELTGRLLIAQESERKRIARELHDDFGQNLALLSVEMDILQQSPLKSREQLAEYIETMAARVKQLSSSIHELSHQLHPIKLEQLGLLTALGSLCKELSRVHGLTIPFSHNGLPTLTQETSLCIYRVAQEALSNAIRHSGANTVKVALAATQSVVSLEIADDGRGFDPATIANREGLGLVSIRERLRAVDGSLIVDTKPSHGTRLEIVISLANNAKNL